MISKQSFTKVDSSMVNQNQLSKVIGTRWVNTERPSRNEGRQVKCRFCGKGFSQHIHDKDVQTFAATRVRGYAVYTTNVASAFLNTPADEDVFVQPPKEYYHNRPNIRWSMRKALYGRKTLPKQRQEHLSTIQ
eukprot:1898810-Amphidinium_carterae.1